MKFYKSQDSSWNALAVYVNSQCILSGSKPQNENFLFAFCLNMDSYFAWYLGLCFIKRLIP